MHHTFLKTPALPSLGRNKRSVPRANVRPRQFSTFNYNIYFFDRL